MAMLSRSAAALGSLILASLVAVIDITVARAQGPLIAASADLTLTGANAMLDAAEARARELSLKVSLAIVDNARNLKAFRRMDGSLMTSVPLAQEKAYTAISYGMDTDSMIGFLLTTADKNPTVLPSHTKLPHITLTPGGAIIRINGLIVGAIGVSGAGGGRDVEVIDVALAAVGAARREHLNAKAVAEQLGGQAR
jgi:uncharacterized protein GlcG (DUF336 family)